MISPMRDELVGMKLEDAVKLLEDQGLKARVVSEDGVEQMHTADARSDRYNLTVVDGVVTDAYVG